MTVTYSFMILCYNKWPLTETCITTLARSLTKEMIDTGVEFVVLDNGSTDETPVQLERLERVIAREIQFRVVRMEQNMGFPTGANIGLSHCVGTFIALLSNDLVFPEGWADSLIMALKNDRAIGVAVPYLSYASSIQNLGRNFSTIDEMEVFASNFMANNSDKVTYTERVITACTMFRRDALETVGGNDFWFGQGNFDDDDLCLRLQIAGYKLAVIGGSYVHHVGSATFKDFGSHYQNLLTYNKSKFERKWDISEGTNSQGTYTRKGVVRHVPYHRPNHFFPLGLQDFNNSPGPLLPSGAENRVIIVADWTSPTSRWLDALLRALPQAKGLEIGLMAPERYYWAADITARLERESAVLSPLIAENQVRLTIFTNNFSPIELIQVLRSGRYVVEVADDFVNRFTLYLAREHGIAVQQFD